MIFRASLPVPLMSFEPISVSFSTYLGNVWETELRMRSLPELDASITLSPAWFTRYVSFPVRPRIVSAPAAPFSQLPAEFPVIASLPDPPIAFSINERVFPW